MKKGSDGNVIEVNGLSKVFQQKKKQAGFYGSIKSIYRPHIEEITAVKDITFTLKTGEICGYIGPNGAGKSTTLKMLNGIIHPSSGSAVVCGKIPWLERKKLSLEIGSVFGQRPQLWFHLPPIDSFNLFASIFNLSRKHAGKRIAKLSEELDIKDFLFVPTRKLSLGQRMRCEIAASLIHEPRLLFLDEPSIGLDSLARKKMREMITNISECQGVSVLLTSHDSMDVESVCKKTIVLNKGSIIFHDTIEELKKRYLRFKEITIYFDGDISSVGNNFSNEKYVLVKSSEEKLTLRISQDTPIREAVDFIETFGKIRDFTIANPSLDDVINEIYKEIKEYPKD